jgi:type II secretory pathway pseudopilin PulG
MRVRKINSRVAGRGGWQSGYMLLTLMFFVVVLTFSMMATLPKLVTQIKRDREEEMIHRGTDYARAIKKFYKKFNRYPNSLEDLENTNNIRFLRRRYKDPESKDGKWKLLHVTDVQQGISNPNFGVSQASNFNPTQGQQMPGGIANGPGTGMSVGGGSQGGLATPPDPTQDPGNTGGLLSSGQTGTNPVSPTSSGATGSSTSTGPGGTGGPGGQTFGGGGVVGVQSASKSKTVREFGGKANYNKWMFIYDPTQDRGGLLKGPYNPQAFQGNGTNGAPGVQGLPGSSGPIAPNTGQQPQGGNPGPTMPPDQNAPPQ